MEPRIQYAKTSDGVRIAFAVVGHGPPLVVSGELADAHAQLIWREDMPHGIIYRSLAERCTVIKYDSRGLGLSDRDYSHLSLNRRLLDIEAVANHLRLDRFSLLGIIQGGPLAICYAARHPQQVSKLALAGSPVRTAEAFARHRIGKVTALIQTDWQMFLENLAAVNIGYGQQEASRVAEFLAACVEPEGMLRLSSAWAQDDATEALPAVQCPTLIVHPSEVHYLTIEMARELTSGIRDSQLVVVETDWLRRLDEIGSLISDFVVGEDTMPAVPSGTAIILFADIVDSTALTERLGDATFRDKARDLDATLRTIIRDNAGTPIEGKLLGDGVLAVFTSARQAIEAALACGRAGDEGGLPLHLGLHAGDVIREDDNVYGGAVNIASRISGLSAPGEVLVSETVRSLARTSAGVSFGDRGEQSLKGVGEPVRVWKVETNGGVAT